MATARSGPKRLVVKSITVPGNLRQGCDHFNEGRFFESHESFEEIWQMERGPVRNLYKGIIQIAAGFVHITRANDAGARRLLETGTAYLQPFCDTGAMGFNVDALVSSTNAVRTRLDVSGSAGVDLSLRPILTVDWATLPLEAVRWQAWGFDQAGKALAMTISVFE